MIFLVVSECSHYKRVRCENAERQGEPAGALLSVRKGSSCSPPSKLSSLLLASNSLFTLLLALATAKLFYKLIGMQVLPDSELNFETLVYYTLKTVLCVLFCIVARRQSA